MALQFEIDDTEGLDDAVKSLYVEHDGKFRLDVDGIDPADELKEALRKEREVRKGEENKRREAEKAAQEERERIAKEKGDFEQLHKSSEERYQNTVKELDQLRSGIAAEKRDNAALKIAAELADGANAKLLSAFIAPRLKHTEEGIKVTNVNGELTVSTLDDLKTEFKNNADYAALLKGNQSSGGGAAGGSNSGGAAKVKTRAEFDALNQNDRMEFTKSGGKITTA